jgi:hypothetical protein
MATKAGHHQSGFAGRWRYPYRRSHQGSRPSRGLEIIPAFGGLYQSGFAWRGGFRATGRTRGSRPSATLPRGRGG